MTDAEAQPTQPQHELSSTDPVSAATDPMIVFAYSCLRREFRSLLSHRPSHDTIPSPDEIHRTRIAARRLRVALRSFKDLLPGDVAVTLKGELRWFARALGKVRDLDVYAENFRVYLQAIPEEQRQELAAFEQHLQHARGEARSHLASLFSDRRYEALLASFHTFLANAPSAGALRRWRSFRICDGARTYLETSVKDVLKRGDKIAPDAPAKRLHRLRIKAKRLRYELEFFGEIYPSLESSAKAAKRLQDVLGEYQDACTASHRLHEYLDEHGGEARTALEGLLRSEQRKAADARRQFAAEWRRFTKSISLSELRTLLAA